MRGFPGGWSETGGIDPANVDKLLVFVPRPKADHRFLIANVRAERRVQASRRRPTPPKLFPMIDAFGQYVHKDWPGKIHTAADFAARKTGRSRGPGRATPAPADWDQYGGWKAGPQLAAAGRFRVEKREGKWWLVDPEGRLFWSHGIDCVRMENATPTTDREHWFAALPARSDPLGRFYGHGNWAPHGYYEGKSYETFNFTGANLLRKYGDDWNRHSAANVHVRLRSWGHEHDRQLVRRVGHRRCARRPTWPRSTSAAAQSRAARATGASSPTPSTPTFARSARQGMAAERNRAVGDPWCLGYFVGNELSWGDETSLASAALASPADQPAKKAFLADLKAKYGQIERLNAAWGTRHASWDVAGRGRTAARRQEGPRRPGRLLHPHGRAVLPRLPRGGQGSPTRRSSTWAAASPGPTTWPCARRPSTATWSASTATSGAWPTCACPRASTGR